MTKEEDNSQPLHGAWADTQPGARASQRTKIEIPLGESPAVAPAGASAAAPPPGPGNAHPGGESTYLPLGAWLREGLRATLLRAPRTGAARPTPWQLAVLVLLSSGLLLAAARLEVPGPAQFQLRGWLAPMWTMLVLLWCAWWAMAPAQRQGARLSGGPAAWYALISCAAVVPTVLLYALLGWAVRMPALWHAPGGWGGAFWAGYGALTLWALAALVVVSARFIGSRLRTGAFAAALLLVVTFGAWQFPDRPWEAAAPAEGDVSQGPEPEGEPAPVLQLSQSAFEAQQALWQRQAAALAPERAGVVDVYGLVFAPYAGEEVFRRESTMVAALLAERFGAQGRVLHLLNHAGTAATHPWATPENLHRAIAALGERMDREQDVLVVYLTSHGARDHALAAAHAPLEVGPITPQMLRAALDAAGIRQRVVAVSACYSGGWIGPLEDPGTLIMTAADATHTSYGCGTLSELTFFGRAVFDEELRQTRSFTDAFARAVPRIARREVEAGKADGFSNPQIRVGAQVGPVLAALAQRLDAEPAAGAATTPP